MLIRFIVNAVALAVATWIVPGIWLADGDRMSQVLTLLGVAVIFGVVNTLVKPLLKFATGLLILLTMGLFLIVLNTLLLLLVAWVAAQFGLAWHVDDWLAALLGALIVSVVGFVLSKVGKGK